MQLYGMVVAIGVANVAFALVFVTMGWYFFRGQALLK
jgi:hypothetical protein